MVLTDIYRKFHSNTKEYLSFFISHEMFSKIFSTYRSEDYWLESHWRLSHVIFFQKLSDEKAWDVLLECLREYVMFGKCISKAQETVDDSLALVCPDFFFDFSFL